MIERRKEPRYPVALVCDMLHGGVRLLSRTRDLSRGGISVEAKQALQVSDVVELALVLVFSDGRSEPLRLKGVVVWCTPIPGGFQIGAKFAPLTAQQRAFIEVFLKFLDGAVAPPTGGSTRRDS